MTILENIQQLLRHLTTEQELKEVKKMVALLEMELNDKKCVLYKMAASWRNAKLGEIQLKG